MMKIYTMTHKPFTPPQDTLYVPLQVGAALHDKLGYLTDDTGDQISEQNPYYSEDITGSGKMTGLQTMSAVRITDDI